MNKVIVGVVLATALLIGGGIFLLSRPPQTFPEPTTPEYFWGDGCPHCKIVSDFVDSWDKKDKLDWTKYEVWYTKPNLKRYEARAVKCQIPKDQMGVPLLYTPEGKCLNGDQPIIEYLKNKY